MRDVTGEMFNWPHTPDQETYATALRHAEEDERLNTIWQKVAQAHNQYRSAMLAIHGEDIGEHPTIQKPQNRPHSTEANALRFTYRAQDWANSTREGVMIEGGGRDDIIRKVLENAQYSASTSHITVAAFHPGNHASSNPQVTAWLISRNEDWAGMNPRWPKVEDLNVYVVEDHDEPGLPAFITAVPYLWNGSPLPEKMSHIETIARYHGAKSIQWIPARDLPEEIRPKTREQLNQEAEEILRPVHIHPKS